MQYRAAWRYDHPQVGKLVGIQPNSAVLRGHTLLKKDRDQIGSRAESIATGNVTVDQASKVGGLAKYLGAEFDIVVNFDPGSGFLTGVALRGTLFAPFGHKFQKADGEAQSIRPLGEAAFVVSKDNAVAEWAALNSFIERFATWIDDAKKVFDDHGMGTLRTQICFWELRQYTELCNAFGRHLLDILQLSGRSQRALAWIFPAEELMEKAEQICPNIVFIKDIVTASVRLLRQWHGRVYEGIVEADGVLVNGKKYRSLSDAARSITGVHWSGTRFFGIRKARAA